MKKFVFVSLVALIATNSFCQTSSLEQAINEGLTQFDSAKTISDVQAAVSRFQRIAMAEPNRWEPLYHLAYTQIIMNFWENDGEKKDKILDQAELSINKALEMNCDKSELHALQGFLYQGRIQVNATRGLTYSQMAAEVIGMAIHENPNNPRALFLMGQNIFYTPESFGGGPANALPEFMKAKVLFEKEANKNGINPRWGAASNLTAIENCNK